MEARQHTVHRGFFLIAALIVGLGGALRFAYIGRGYTHPDEPIASAVVAQLHASRGLDTDWAHTPIGDRYGRAQYNFSSYYLVLAGWDRLLRLAGIERGPVDAPQTLASGLELPEAKAPRSLAGFRAFSALLGTLVLILAMRLAGAMGDWRLALGVGAWLAVNPQLVHDSHYARPETFLTLLATGLILLCFPNRRWSWQRGIATGALFGFLTACKITMLLWGWVPFMICFELGLADRLGGIGLPRVWRLFSRMGLVVAAMTVGFVAGVPRVFGDFRGYWAGMEYLRKSYGHEIGPYSHPVGGMVYDYLARYFFDTSGWWIVVLFGVGFAAVVVKRQWTVVLAVFAPVLIVATFFSAQSVFFERNLSHAVPLYFLGAGLGLAALTESSHRAIGRWKPVLVAALFLATLLLSALLTVRMDYQGFSGRFETKTVEARNEILARFRGTPAYEIRGDGLAPFELAWSETGRRFIVFWVHANDPLAKYCYQELTGKFALKDMGRIPGLFDDLSAPSGLRDYFPCATEVFLIEGLRQAPGLSAETSGVPIPPRMAWPPRKLVTNGARG